MTILEEGEGEDEEGEDMIEVIVNSIGDNRREIEGNHGLLSTV